MKSMHSSPVKERTDGARTKCPLAIIATQLTDGFRDSPHTPDAAKQHKVDPDMQSGGWRGIYLSARTAIYSSDPPSPPPQCGVTRCRTDGERAAAAAAR